MGFCCISSTLCCAGQALCNCLCMPCAKAGVANKNFAKIGYVVFQVSWIAISLFLMVSAKKLVSWFPDAMLSCPEQSGGASACLGASAIIRMSFALMLFSCLMFIIVITRTKLAASFHDGCWCVKVLFVAAIFTGSMWISNDFMKGYMTMAKWVSTLFLIYQALLMLLVSYKINDTLVSNFNKDPSACSKYILIFATLAFFGVTVWQVIAQFQEFYCASNKFIMIITVCAVVMIHGLVFLKPRQDASILTSSIASVYMLYLQWSALSSNQDKTCNPNLGKGSNTFWQITLGLLITFVSLALNGATVKSDDEEELYQEQKDSDEEEENNREKLIQDHNEKTKKKGKKHGNIQDEDMDPKAEAHVFEVSSATIMFQLTMILSAIYLSMLCTNWGDVTVFNNTTNFFGHSQTSFWLKLTAQWFTIAIFLFSLIGPMLFPNRDFGQN